jgi:hypothetical protein
MKPLDSLADHQGRIWAFRELLKQAAADRQKAAQAKRTPAKVLPHTPKPANGLTGRQKARRWG